MLRRKPPGELLKSAHAVDREFRVISALSGTDVPVAKAYHLCEEDSAIGSMFYLMEFIDGRVMWAPSLPNDRNSTVRLIRMIGPDIARSERLYHDAATGQRLDYQPTEGVGKDVRMTLVNLHEGLFAGSLLRWLYFFSGLVGAAMIATGLVLWVKKRSNNKPASAQNYGSNTITRLNNGLLIGTLTAIAGYFWINRVVPVEWDNRVSLEQNGFFVILALTVIYSAFQQPRRGARHLLLINSVLFGILPLACEGFGGGGLISAAVVSDLTLLGFNFALLATALLSLAGWIKLRPANELHLSRNLPS